MLSRHHPLCWYAHSFRMQGLLDTHAASQIQNLLICIEMFMASIAHFYVFPYEEWGKNYEKEQKKIGLFRDTLALNDFVTDIGMMARSKPYAWEGESSLWVVLMPLRMLSTTGV